jgi:hypothetical protein
MSSLENNKYIPLDVQLEIEQASTTLSYTAEATVESSSKRKL